ncbi:MAG TPA: hypothetical protein VKJ47_21440 [Candidatus Binatia bacterium]|nr:hypothetical protein [Candidatus Binatia bacterium]
MQKQSPLGLLLRLAGSLLMSPLSLYPKLGRSRSLGESMNRALREESQQKIRSQWAGTAKRGGITGGLWMPI